MLSQPDRVGFFYDAQTVSTCDGSRPATMPEDGATSSWTDFTQTRYRVYEQKIHTIRVRAVSRFDGWVK